MKPFKVEYRSPDDGAQRLLIEPRHSWFKRITSYLSYRNSIDEVHRNIVQERLNRIEIEEFIADGEWRGSLGKGTLLYSHFAKFRELTKGRLWADFMQVATFFEDRRKRLFGNLTILAAGIVGGIIGALIGSTATLYAASLTKGAVAKEVRASAAATASKQQP